MTDRLTDLLHAETRTLDVPPPATAAVLARGRSIRRRRRAGAGAVVAAVAVVATSLTVAGLGRGDDDAVQPADREAYLERGAFVVGDELHVGDHVVALPGDDPVTLSYTSEGVMVWQHRFDPAGETEGWTALVTPAGEVRELEIDGLEGHGFTSDDPPLATDPDAPYLALARSAGPGRSEVVLHDLRTGEEQVVVAPYDGDAEVRALSGDVLYYVRASRPRFVDRRSEERLPDPSGGFVQGVTAGRVLMLEQSRWRVEAFPAGETLLAVPTESIIDTDPGVELSPDGRWLLVPGADGQRVYDVDTGEHRVLKVSTATSGWTPDGHVVGASYGDDGGDVVVCDPATGECEGTGVAAEGLTTAEGASH